MKSNKNIFGGIMSVYRERQEPERMRLFAQLFWRLMMGSMFLFLVTIVVCGVFELVHVTDSIASEGVADIKTTGSTLTHADLTAVLDAVANRQAHFEALTKNPPVITDPSK